MINIEAKIWGVFVERLEAIAAACERLRILVDEFDRLGMVLTAALASQAHDAANAERETSLH